VIGVQPPVIEMAALFSFANRDHCAYSLLTNN
jgi:hypothetical protein